MVAKDFDRAGTPLGVFGAELRYYRTNAGLSQTDLAARVHVSHDVISKIETGDRPPAEDFPARLDAVPEMDTREALGRLWGQLRKGLRHRAYPGWFALWADIEAEATALRSYEPLLVPGLLQTEDYARAILSARPGGDDDDLEEQVAARMERQAIVSQPGGPLLWCVLDEGVLHRPVGGGKVMRTQLERLAGLADHQKTTVQVIPVAAGAHAGLLGAFVLAETEGSPASVYLETSAEGQVTENPSVAAHVALRFDRLRSEALPRGASRDLIKKVAEEQWT
jgi:transcriptional regulator with XRE-family HTH domain